MPSGGANHTIADPISFAAFDAVLASVCVIAAALVAGLAWYMYRRRMPRGEGETEYRKCGAAWTLSEIDAATDGFGAGRLLGGGPRGNVYRAIFPDGRVLAAKRIIDPVLDPALEFAAQMKALARARHPNVVAVVGWCEAPAERIVVTQYMARRSLHYHLHQGGLVLDWCHRVRIAVQAAEGIQYLHEGTAPPILHGDIKPSNVLLDATWSARVADFGLAFLARPDEVWGSAGYADPRRRRLSKPADVYAFGVVLLELLSGRPCFGDRSRYIVDWALPLIAGARAHEVFDPRLQVPPDPRPLLRMAGLAAACVRNAGNSRPTILGVVAVLKYVEAEIMAASYVSSQRQPYGEHHQPPLSKPWPFTSRPPVN